MTVQIASARKISGAKIAVYLTDGREFVLKHKFAHRDDIKLIETLAKIREAGKINLNNWRSAHKGEC